MSVLDRETEAQLEALVRAHRTGQLVLSLVRLMDNRVERLKDHLCSEQDVDHLRRMQGEVAGLRRFIALITTDDPMQQKAK